MATSSNNNDFWNNALGIFNGYMGSQSKANLDRMNQDYDWQKNKYGYDVNSATSRYNTDVNAFTSKYNTDTNLQAQADQAQLNRDIYNAMVGRGQTASDQAEKAYMDNYSTPYAGLDQLKQDYANKATLGQTNALSQTQAALRSNGVRGGQAATILGRQQGQMGIDANQGLNDLAYQDYLRRNQAIGSFQQNKATNAASGVYGKAQGFGF